MRSIEFTGKTLEEAKELAVKQLGVSEDRIRFEVLEEGSKGFLGISHHPARLRATVIDEEEQPEQSIAESDMDEDAGPEPGNIREDIGLGGKSEGEWTLDLLTDILVAANLDATPKLISEADESIEIEIEGPDVAILIGKHGQTLDALQYLLGVALNRAAKSRTRVTLDAEKYRDRHAEALTARALEYARRVKETGEEAVLDPQSPRDRRIMHMALADDEDVYTYSEGEGDERHVVISPKK